MYFVKFFICYNVCYLSPIKIDQYDYCLFCIEKYMYLESNERIKILWVLRNFNFPLYKGPRPSPRRDITGSEMLKISGCTCLVSITRKNRWQEDNGKLHQRLFRVFSRLCAKGSCVLNQTDGKVFPSTWDTLIVIVNEFLEVTFKLIQIAGIIIV